MRKKIAIDQYERITESKLKTRLKEAIDSGRLKRENLPEKVQEDLGLDS